MMRHLEEFALRVKLSGTAEELESFQYLQRCLEGYGYQTALLSHDAYISLPGRARLEWTAGTERFAPRSITHSFSCSSSAEGTRGTVVLEQDDMRGKIALIDGMASPAASYRATQAGAVGQIHISVHEHIHEMCISPVWGNPTHETRSALPRTVVLSISKADGEALKARIKEGQDVQAVLHAKVDTGWRKIPLLVAERMPENMSDAPFVLFSGHHDTWYYGVMDNGSANALMLEVARLCMAERAQWKRGLRLCFWSGHSHGRYAGSTWYADNHWQELAQRCVVHVNAESAGGKGATVLTDAPASAELLAVARHAIRAEGHSEIDGLRMGRAGDQSFWGIGIPSLFMGVSEQPAGCGDNPGAAVFGSSARMGAGYGWWWHTPEDTIDKIDPELLVRDTRIYVHALVRLLNEDVLPLDYVAYAEYLTAHLEALERELGGRFDLSRLVRGATDLRYHACRLKECTDTGTVNRALMAAGRALVPVDYTTGDRFGHDPAVPQQPYPALDVLRLLAKAPAGSDDAKFIEVAARRAFNRVASALDEANSHLKYAREG
jgi:hypothetical protein